MKIKNENMYAIVYEGAKQNVASQSAAINWIHEIIDNKDIFLDQLELIDNIHRMDEGNESTKIDISSTYDLTEKCAVYDYDIIELELKIERKPVIFRFYLKDFLFTIILDKEDLIDIEKVTKVLEV